VIDCLGNEVSEEEIARWDELLITDRGTPNQAGAWHPVMFRGRETQRERALNTQLGFWDYNLPVDRALVTGTVVELGCGTGRCAEFIAGLAEEYIGLDLSREALIWAWMRYKTWPNVSFLHTVDQRERVLALEGTCQGVFGVNFFIHQDAARMEMIIETVGRLLVAGGWFSMDLWTEGRLDRPPEPWQPGLRWTAFPQDWGWLRGLLERNGLKPGERIEAGDLREYLICRKG